MFVLQPAAARGIGIRVVGKFSEIPKKKTVLVQQYLSSPYLINDSKFDMRIYVYITSYDPLRIYVYDNGLARFASVKYENI
jgi:tubulin polyglutamylase TTLL4